MEINRTSLEINKLNGSIHRIHDNGDCHASFTHWKMECEYLYLGQAERQLSETKLYKTHFSVSYIVQ